MLTTILFDAPDAILQCEHPAHDICDTTASPPHARLVTGTVHAGFGLAYERTSLLPDGI